MNLGVDQFKTTCYEQKDNVNDKKQASTQKTYDLLGTDILHQVDTKEGSHYNQSHQNKGFRVKGYMNSNGMGGIMTGHEKDTGELDVKAAIHGTGEIIAKDVWAPKAYQAHGNDGKQRFYI